MQNKIIANGTDIVFNIHPYFQLLLASHIDNSNKMGHLATKLAHPEITRVQKSVDRLNRRLFTLVIDASPILLHQSASPDVAEKLLVKIEWLDDRFKALLKSTQRSDTDDKVFGPQFLEEKGALLDDYIKCLDLWFEVTDALYTSIKDEIEETAKIKRAVIKINRWTKIPQQERNTVH